MLTQKSRNRIKNDFPERWNYKNEKSHDRGVEKRLVQKEFQEFQESKFECTSRLFGYNSDPTYGGNTYSYFYEID